MKILHIAPTYYPATYWGGPIWSTKAICDGIAALPDIDLRVLTTDAASPALDDRVMTADLPYPVHYTRRIAGHAIAPAMLARLPRAISWADVVHLTGTYNMPTLPTLALARLLNTPVVWSPRGALQATVDWADAPNIRAKHLFERLADIIRPRDTVLHVTAPAEAAQSTTRLPCIGYAVIPNCVDIPQDIAPKDRDGQTCRLLFLGRLHPKKGLSLLLNAVDRLPAGFTLDVYGSGDPDYTARLQDRAARSNGRIRLHGHVEGRAKQAAFAAADMFVLPSFSENFGIAVAEALAHATPVLTTTATPWANMAKHDCGRSIDLSTDDLACEIERLARRDLPAMGARGRDWMTRQFSTTAMVAAFHALYRDMLEQTWQGVPA